MALEINELVCTLSSANQGVGTCNYTMAPFIFFIAIPKGSTITATDAVNMRTFLQGKRTANDPLQRYYQSPRLNDVTANAQEAAYQQASDGSQFVTRDTIWMLQFIINNASMCQQQNALRGWDYSQDRFDYLFVDTNFKLVGQKVINSTTGATEIGGFPPQYVYTQAMTLPGYAATPNLQVDMNFLSVKQLQANWAVIDLSNSGFLQDAFSFQVNNVTIQNFRSTAANTFKGTLVTGCGNQIIGKAGLLATQFLQPGAYAFYNVTDGASLAVTNVSFNDATGEATWTTATIATGKVVRAALALLQTAGALTTPVKWYEVAANDRPTAIAV